MNKTVGRRGVSGGVAGVGTDARQSQYHTYILSPPWLYGMSREKILSFTKIYFDKHGVSPSIRAIADGVDGVDRKSFYQYFKDKGELLVALGIKEEVIKPEAAMEAKKAAKKDGDYLVTLNRGQSEKLIAIAFMDGKPVSLTVDEILEDQRQVRQVMVDVNGGRLDSEIIRAILNPELVYEGWNVSEHAGKPWFILKCSKCGDDIFIGEGIDYNKWLFEVLPVIKRVFSLTCDDCLPKPPTITRIPA